MINISETTVQETRVFPVDIEHSGIRLALPLITVAGFFILLAGTSALLQSMAPDSGLGCIAVGLSVAGALLVAALSDRLLKRFWPSGRTLALDAEGVQLQDRRRNRGGEVRLSWDQRINVLAWRFTVKRGSARIQKGWVMLGCQLLQDEAQMTLYTFVPANEADEARYTYFTQLVLREVLNKGQLPLREMNQQRRLLRAEDERWRDGAELHRQDFALLIETVAHNKPNWQSTPD